MRFSLGIQNETGGSHGHETETKIVAKLLLVKPFRMLNTSYCFRNLFITYNYKGNIMAIDLADYLDYCIKKVISRISFLKHQKRTLSHLLRISFFRGRKCRGGHEIPCNSTSVHLSSIAVRSLN